MNDIILKINVDDYLSEEEKKELVKEFFKEEVKKGILKKSFPYRKIENYERIISNSIHHYLEKEIDNILKTDTKELIRKNVLRTIEKENYSYFLFRKKNAWEEEDSPAQKVVKEAVLSYKNEMTEKIHLKLEEMIDSISFEDLVEHYKEIFYDFLLDHLTKKD